MKFGKSYMETLASPSFPKEWREGAIEYKQLKKLINGVVAELESLGLGADVLRDLIVPNGEQDSENEAKSGSDEDEILEKLQDEDEGHNLQKRKYNIIDSHEGPSDTSMDRNESKSSSSSFHHQHLLQRGDSSSHDISIGSSADDCDECAKDLLHHTSKNRNKDSPAADWVAHIAHAKHSRGRRKSNRREISPLNKERDKSQFLDIKPTNFLRPSTAQSAPFSTSFDGSAIHSDTYSGQGTSGDDSGQIDQPTPTRMGKKQLEELRRRYSSVDGIQSYRASNASASSKSKDRIHDWGGHAWRERGSMQNKLNDSIYAQKSSSGKSHIKRWVMGKDGRRARAEYELGGTSEKPIPRIRLYVESPVQSDDEIDDGGEADSEGESEDDPIESEKDEEEEEEEEARITELGTSPRESIGSSTIKPLQGHPRSPIIRPTNENGGKKRVRTREIIIPLNADTEFLDTLTGALSNLSSLQETQRKEFQQSTEALCSAVSKVASPYGNKNDLYAWREIFSLWCELQIFESQREKDRGELSVDETEARLKRFAEELAKRGWNTEAFAMEASQKELKVGGDVKKKGKFVGKLTKWKSENTKSTAGALPMKDARSIAALEDFIKLNLALLDVKKFQRVNIEAARKILKKHDKRTALTASSDLGIFVEHEERMRKATASAAAGFGISSLVNIPEQSVASNHAIVSTHGAFTHPSLAALLPSSTSALISASLPHILLSLMTTELLPILPSIDDYSCAICTGVAWRPIKLDCGHLFCIRCLVKLQKQGKNDCPMCRAPGAVGSADERNMDVEMVDYLRDWFPKEVDEKDKENERDRHKEEMLELGLALENEKCTIM